jgi:sugar O-acyltransferase (sialic acid O-acetyltransferase NeuD family)
MKQQRNETPIDLVVMGAGGHGKVVIDTLIHNGVNQMKILDDSPDAVGCFIQGVEIFDLQKSTSFSIFHIAIGNNQTRENLYLKYKSNAVFLCVISSDAYIAETASVKGGTFIAPKAVVSADAEIGLGCIINHGAIAEHDCKIGNFCHLAPSSMVLGGAVLGSRVFLGAGAVVLPCVKIADDVIIGAGAVVVFDIIESCTVVGIPAKKIKGSNDN